MYDRQAHLLAPWDRQARGNPVVGAIDTLLRGAGQVMFQNNPVTGLLFLVGIFFNAITTDALPLGWGALIGLASSTLAAVVLGADRDLVRNGLFGFNGILLGIGLAVFLQFDGVLIVYIVIGSVVSTVVMMALSNFLGQWDMPALTAPFVLSALLFLAAAYLSNNLHFGPLVQPGLPAPAASVPTGFQPQLTSPGGAASVDVVNVLQGFFRGVGQVMFQDNLITGIIFLVAILVNSRISAVFAALGSAIGLLTSLVLLGGSGFFNYHGLYGFNSVLTGIAIGGVFFVLTWKSALYALVGMLITAIVTASLTAALAPIGMPALTAPFVVTTWLFLLPKALFSILRPVPLAEVAAPERILETTQAQERMPGAAAPQM
jgi:urea transporter